MREINDSVFDIESQNGNKIIQFHSDWCAPCKEMTPIIKQLETKFSNITFLNIDVEKNNESVLKASVMSLPTLLFLKDGKELNRIIGFRNSETIVEYIKRAFS